MKVKLSVACVILICHFLSHVVNKITFKNNVENTSAYVSRVPQRLLKLHCIKH